MFRCFVVAILFVGSVAAKMTGVTIDSLNRQADFLDFVQTEVENEETRKAGLSKENIDSYLNEINSAKNILNLIRKEFNKGKVGDRDILQELIEKFNKSKQEIKNILAAVGGKCRNVDLPNIVGSQPKGQQISGLCHDKKWRKNKWNRVNEPLVVQSIVDEKKSTNDDSNSKEEIEVK